VRHPYVAVVPQWDLLDLLAEAAEAESGFRLHRGVSATSIIRENGRVVGVTHRRTGVAGDSVDGETRAELTIACDGRDSVLRADSGLPVAGVKVPFDTWWFRLSRRPGEQVSVLTRHPGRGCFAVVIPREGYFQIGYVARKGLDAALRDRGIEQFRADIADLLPEYADRVGELASMDEVHHLDVRLDRLRRWHVDGMLCIGDSAHAMSPVGGMGIGLAVQDAIAAAALLAGPLRRGVVTGSDLARVRRRRWLPLLLVQVLQRVMHADLAGPIVNGTHAGPVGPLLTVATRLPFLQTLAVYLIGVGFRPERAPGFARRISRVGAQQARGLPSETCGDP
jgi:2-polyprenyl-6-methoxyphenol hydroxylase-like FAD-dependent oxidoreductase